MPGQGQGDLRRALPIPRHPRQQARQGQAHRLGRGCRQGKVCVTGIVRPSARVMCSRMRAIGLEPVAQRGQQPVRLVGQRGQQAVAVGQRRLELDPCGDFGALPGRHHRPVVQPLRPPLRRAPRAGRSGSARRPPAGARTGPACGIPRCCSCSSASASSGRAAAGWPARKVRCAAGASEQSRVLPGDLRPRRWRRTCCPSRPGQAASPGRGLQPPRPGTTAAPRARCRPAGRRGGERRLQVNPAQAVRLPAVGVVLDAGQELFTSLLWIRKRSGEQRGGGTMRRCLALALAEARRRPRRRTRPPPAPGGAHQARPVVGSSPAAAPRRATSCQNAIHRKAIWRSTMLPHSSDLE